MVGQRGKPEFVEKLQGYLRQTELSIDVVMAQALHIRLNDIERIDRMIMDAEARRKTTGPREIDRHRAALADALRRATEQNVRDAEFTEAGCDQATCVTGRTPSRKPPVGRRSRPTGPMRKGARARHRPPVSSGLPATPSATASRFPSGAIPVVRRRSKRLRLSSQGRALNSRGFLWRAGSPRRRSI